MSDDFHTDSRKMLKRLRAVMADDATGQRRLDQITDLMTAELRIEVCSIYLFRDAETLELCATKGLNPSAVHKTRMRLGEGLVGRVARTGEMINTANAPLTPGFRLIQNTGEEGYLAFLGVPIQRLGEKLGVLVVQSRTAREFSEEEIYAVEVVAMVLAEMAELGAFVGEGAAMSERHKRSVLFRGATAQEGTARGHVWLHEPRVLVTNLIGENPAHEMERLNAAVEELRSGVDRMLTSARFGDKEQLEVLEAYRMFANSKGWMRRMEQDIQRGLSAEAAVEKEQTSTRARLSQVSDAYLRDRLHDLDDLSNRMLRILTGQTNGPEAEMPPDPILIARNIGPAELLDYGRSLKGIVLSEGAVGSHATIVARALAIPLVIHATNITTEALNGDPILVDGDQGIVHLRPDETVFAAFRDKMAMQAKAQERYASIRDKPATTLCGRTLSLAMNAGLMAELPSLESSGADGVGLFRTELQFLVRSKMPKRAELSTLYSRVMDAAKGRPVVFRTLDIGSDKVLPYMKPTDEPNPALGWRAIRVGLDKRGMMRMQLQALIRGANGRPLSIMFPLVAEADEFDAGRAELDKALERERILGHRLPETLKLGAMLEAPSLAYASDQFYRNVDFLSIGGNDLKQFFFAADRENERVRRRYDTLNVSFLTFLQSIIERCMATNTPLSFCGEDAGRPVDAACFAAIGIRTLSMRPASIGPVKSILRRTNLDELRSVIDAAGRRGDQSVRPVVMEYLRGKL